MGILAGLVINTVNEAKNQSQHSTLMRFYALDKEIEFLDEKRLDEYLDGKIDQKEYRSLELPIMFLRAEAKTLLYILGI